MSFTTLFTKRAEGGVFNLKASREFFDKKSYQADKPVDEQELIKNQIIELGSQLTNNKDNAYLFDSQVGAEKQFDRPQLQIDYVKKIGLDINGSNICYSKSLIHSKHLIVSVWVEDDSPHQLDCLKKTYEGFLSQLGSLNENYGISAENCVMYVFFQHLDDMNFDFLYGKDRLRIIYKNQALLRDTPFFYSFVDINGLQESIEDRTPKLELLIIYKPRLTKFGLDRCMFMGILPHIKLNEKNNEEAIGIPLFFLNLEAGTIMKEGSLNQLYASLTTPSSPNPTDSKTSDIFYKNNNLAALGFVEEESGRQSKICNFFSSIQCYESTISSIYELGFGNLTSNFDLNRYCCMFKFSLNNLSKFVDYYFDRSLDYDYFDYESNIFLHLARFPIYITNEMGGGIAFNQSAKIELYSLKQDYASWTENNCKINASKWIRFIVYLSHLFFPCFKSSKSRLANYYNLFNMLSILIDFTFAGLVNIVSFIIFFFSFSSHYGAYTMLILFPTLTILTIISFLSGPIKINSSLIAALNLCFHVYYAFLIASSVESLVNIYEINEFAGLNIPAFVVLIILNFLFAIIPYILYYSRTIKLKSLVSALQFIAFFPNYTSTFIFGSFSFTFNPRHSTYKAFLILLFLAVNFLISVIIYRLNIFTSLNGLLGLSVIGTIMFGYRFAMILANYIKHKLRWEAKYSEHHTSRAEIKKVLSDNLTQKQVQIKLPPIEEEGSEIEEDAIESHRQLTQEKQDKKPIQEEIVVAVEEEASLANIKFEQPRKEIKVTPKDQEFANAKEVLPQSYHHEEDSIKELSDTLDFQSPQLRKNNLPNLDDEPKFKYEKEVNSKDQ